MRRHLASVAIRLVAAIVIPIAFLVAQAQKPLTNTDIVEMVKSGLPESTVVGSMQANPTAFDVSASALIALNQAGVSARVMDAMLAITARNAPKGASAAPNPFTTRTSPASTSTTSSTASSPPSVVLVEGDAKRTLTIERTRVSETSAKAKSLAALSKDRAVDSAVRAGVSEGVRSAGGSAIGSAAGGIAGGVVGSVMSGAGRSKDVTFVWALPGAASQTTLLIDAPRFDVSAGQTIGVRPDEYVPAIVKLTPTATARLVGATEGKEASGSRSAADWPIYSGFIEDQVLVQARKVSSGTWQVTVATPLPPGEYALVFRPVAKAKRFSGADVARNQGDGLMFNAVWSFAVR